MLAIGRHNGKGMELRDGINETQAGRRQEQQGAETRALD